MYKKTVFALGFEALPPPPLYFLLRKEEHAEDIAHTDTKSRGQDRDPGRVKGEQGPSRVP